MVVLDASWHMPAPSGTPGRNTPQAHIPGAVFFDIDAVSDHASTLPHMLPPPSEFAVAARSAGRVSGLHGGRL